MSSLTLATYALFVNRAVVFMQPSKRVAFTAAMSAMAVFAWRFALTLEKAWLEAKPPVAVPTLPLTIAPPQFQTTVDGMGEEMVSSDCGDLIRETD